MNFEHASEIRSKIQQGGIECRMVRKSLTRPLGMKTMGNIGPFLHEYQLFVHNKDVETAQYLMNRPL